MLDTRKKIVIFCVVALFATFCLIHFSGEDDTKKVDTKPANFVTETVTGTSIVAPVEKETTSVEKHNKKPNKEDKTQKNKGKTVEDRATTKKVGALNNSDKVKKDADNKDNGYKNAKENSAKKPVSKAKDSQASPNVDLDSNKDSDNRISSENSAEETKAKTCELSIDCSEVFKYLDLAKPNITKVIPGDGNIFSGNVEIKQGDTVFSVVKRVCEREKIQLDYEMVPMYKTYYIKGISNLYEFDCGDESGWMYRVNGVLPNVGCSGFNVKDKDKVQLFYTCKKQFNV
ncbi:MAG: DUF4430 domain-containing protein [Eubacterium sp.]|nr:DUF4430 domain-containing protein [Eubacterium sp.]